MLQKILENLSSEENKKLFNESLKPYIMNVVNSLKDEYIIYYYIFMLLLFGIIISNLYVIYITSKTLPNIIV